MYHESESEIEKPSQENPLKDKSTALTNFLRTIDADFMAEMG